MMDKKNQNHCVIHSSELLAQSRSYNGYRREEAIIELEKYPSDKMIDALVERANDWVPKIRSRAKQALIRVCNQDTIPHFINHLDKIYHLRNCKREDHSKFVYDIEKRLIGLCKDGLENLKQCNSHSALLYAKLLRKSKVINISMLANACLSHSVTSVRKYAIVLSAKLEVDQKKELLLHCIGDKSGIVRRESLWSFLRNFSNSSYEVCTRLLYDKEKSVRLSALLYLRNNGFNAKEAFKKKLTSEHVHYQKVAIWGFTEIFAKDSVRLILPFIDSKYPSIRAVALKACFVLANEHMLDSVFEQVVKDRSPRVVKECLKLYQKCNALIKTEVFKEVIRDQLEDKNYHFILKMTFKMNKWEQLILLSEISLNANQVLQQEIEKNMSLWLLKLNNFFMDPTKKQIERINNLGRNEKKYWTTGMKNSVKQRMLIAS